MNILVALSGGIDSASCISFYQKAGHDVTGVFVDYGQPVSRQEEKNAKAIARHFGVRLYVVQCTGPRDRFEGELVGRNALLVFAALLYVPNHMGLIALGIHAGTAYYDCSEHFIGHLNALVSGYTNGKSSVAAPFLTWSKQAVYAFCTENKIPIELTWSCEVGPVTPCGNCLSCEDRGHLSVCAAK